MKKLSDNIYEDIDAICDKITNRKKTSKVIRLSHEELVLIRYALIFAIHNNFDYPKCNAALEIVKDKIYRYE